MHAYGRMWMFPYGTHVKHSPDLPCQHASDHDDLVCFGYSINLCNNLFQTTHFHTVSGAFAVLYTSGVLLRSHVHCTHSRHEIYEISYVSLERFIRRPMRHVQNSDLIETHGAILIISIDWLIDCFAVTQMEVANAAANAIQARHGTRWQRGNVCEVVCTYSHCFVTMFNNQFNAQANLAHAQFSQNATDFDAQSYVLVIKPNCNKTATRTLGSVV